jgi:SAM-dependent methyltransferase
MISYPELGQTEQIDIETETLARQSLGSSHNAIYEMVARVIAQQHLGGGILLDMGCGSGRFRSFIDNSFDRYIGVDAARYDGFPKETEFLPLDLNTGKAPLADGFADVVLSVETIEHLENPRAFVRELVRLTKPGGLVMITTPNQLSLLSKLTLILKNQFNAFQEAPGLYPAHITSLLEIDLIRIATECKLQNIQIHYSNHGRMPFVPWHWPNNLGFYGRVFSDNILCIGRKFTEV